MQSKQNEFPSNFMTEIFLNRKKKRFSNDRIFVVVYIKSIYFSFPIASITNYYYLFVSSDLANKNTEEKIHSFMF